MPAHPAGRQRTTNAHTSQRRIHSRNHCVLHTRKESHTRGVSAPNSRQRCVRVPPDHHVRCFDGALFHLRYITERLWSCSRRTGVIEEMDSAMRERKNESAASLDKSSLRYVGRDKSKNGRHRLNNNPRPGDPSPVSHRKRRRTSLSRACGFPTNDFRSAPLMRSRRPRSRGAERRKQLYVVQQMSSKRL